MSTRSAPPQPSAARAEQSAGDASELWVQWNNTVKSLSRHKGKKYNLGALLRDCKVNSISLDGKRLVLPFTNKANFERMQEELEDAASKKRMSDALSQFFGEGCDYELTLANGQQASGNANKTAQQSPLVRAALGMGARIIQEQEVEE